ncbi:MAG: hypothetical protein K2G24_01310 [Muribaculaceae bacterium]|nr:hypothetical protein [Muribaculaceae bacterium]
MKLLKFTLAIGAVLFLSVDKISADTPGGTNGNLSNGPVFIPKTDPKGTRPKAPSAQVVEATYEDGYLYLNFKYSEGPAVLYVYDSEQTTLLSQHMLSTESETAIYIGNISDAYLLIETSNGHEYEGWIY